MWGGQQEFVNRLIHGYDQGVLNIVKQELNTDDESTKKLKEKFAPLSTAIPYQFLPLQDCVDLSIFLIRSTITLQTWQVGIRGVGGAIDVATITQTEGFRYVQQKMIRGESLKSQEAK